LSDVLSIIPDDGYTESAYIAAYPSIHGAHRIKYRPMTHSDRYVMGNALGTKSPGQASELIATKLTKHLKDWDVRAADGAKLPITPANAARLKPNLLERFYAIVSGRDGGDPDPTDKPDSDAMDAELQAILEGRPACEVQEEANVKN